MIRRSSIAAALAVVALPTLVLATAASAHPRHGGHVHHGGHPHHGGHHGGHPHGPRHGFGPHRPHHHGFGGPRHGFGPDDRVRGGRRVVLRPYPVFVGGPVHRAPALRYEGYGVPLAGGCSTRRSASLTPYGWHRTVTVQTCLRP